MGLAKANQGARHTGQTIVWTRSDGTPQDLTGATLSGTLKPRGGTSRAIAGVLAGVAPLTNGAFTWSYAVADVAAAGEIEVQFKAVYADTTYDLTYTDYWIVEPALV